MVVVTIYKNYELGTIVLPDKVTKSAKIIRITDIPREEIFDIMADVKSYPIIFPENFISLNILNSSNNIIFAEEEVTDQRVSIFKVKILAKHTIIPYEKHHIEILNSDLNGTAVTIFYEDISNKTKIIIETNIQARGLFIPLGLAIQQNNLEHAINTAITTFEKFIQNND